VVWSRLSLFCVGVSLFACGTAFGQATVTWVGAYSSNYFESTPANNQENWQDGIVPQYNGTDVLGFTVGVTVNNTLSLNSGAPGYAVAGLAVAGAGGSGESILITGPLTLLLGTDGIAISGYSASQSNLDIEGSLSLTSAQTWSLTNSLIEVDGAILSSESNLITISGSPGSSVILTSGASTFSGGISVNGSGTTLEVGASSTGSPGDVTSGPLGTGTLMLGTGTNFTTTGSGPYEIDNAISLCGGGTVTLLGASDGTVLTLGGMISGSSALEISNALDGSNTVTFTSGCSTFSGGVIVDAGNTTLVVGNSTTGSPGDLTSGPLGTGTLMLGAGTNFTTTGSGCYTIDNDISLCGGGTVTLLGGSDGTMLTLGGMISGSSALEISNALDGSNTVTFTSGCSTFSGGVIVDAGNTTLVVGNSTTGSPGDLDSGPLGTGTLMLGAGTNFTTTGSGCYTIDNDISLCGGGTVTLLGGSEGTMLTLGGMISGASTLEISTAGGDGSNTVAFTSGCSTFCGGVTVDAGNTTLAVGNSSTGTGSNVTSGPLGTGTLTLGDGTNLTTTGSGCYTIGNNINLSGGGAAIVYLLGSPGGTDGTMLTLAGMISGSSALEIEAPNEDSESPNSVYLTSGCSTFSGGVHMDPGYSGLFVGASSTGTGSNVTSGPLGTGTLTLGSGVDFETNGDGCFTIGNNISLCGGGTIYIEGAYGGNNLTLTGMITGCSELNVGYEDETNYLALSSACSTFSGGVSVEPGCTTLAVGASSTGTGSDVTSGPLGTGTLMLSSGNNLTTVDNGAFTIGNDISLCDEGTVYLMENSMGGSLTLGGMISGSSLLQIVASECETGNTVDFTSGCSTFSGGVSVLSGNTTLEVGASSVGSPGDLTSGPLGTGTLMLGDGSNFTTTGIGGYTIGNEITLCGGGTVTLLGGSSGTSLTLSGMISGGSELQIAAPSGDGANIVTLSSSCSTFCGGVTVEGGANVLIVGASGVGEAGDITSSPIGTGTLTMGDNSVLTTPAGTPITILNNIVLGASGGGNVVNLGGASSGTLTLMGTISDYCGPGALDIFGPVDLEGCNTYSGGTTVNSTTLTVGTNTGLGTGQVTANSSVLTFTSSSPVINQLSLVAGSTVNFAAGSTPSIIDMVSDTIGSGNVINLGSGSNTQLTIQVDDDPKYFGTINGNGSIVLTTNSEGELDLEGANTYTGGTRVGADTLLVAANNSALGTGAVTLCAGSAFGVAPAVTVANQINIPNDGVAIGGYGTINPATPQSITIQNGSGVTGGRGSLVTNGGSALSAVGALSFGPNASVVFGQGGGMQFSIINATGTPGTDYSAVNVAGNLNITAGTGEFLIQVVGVDSTGQIIGTANSFNPNLAYSWTLLSAGSITGNLSPTAFTVDATTYFSNPTNFGQFSVTETSNDLTLNFTPVPEPSTWLLMAGGLFALGGVAVRRRRT
jgi:fibronectin-binding autotransporter adhesin